MPREILAQGCAVHLAARSSCPAGQTVDALEHVVGDGHGGLHTWSITSHLHIVAGVAHRALIATRGDTVLCHTDLWGSNLPLDADVFGFYFYRRNLEDLAEFVGLLTVGGIDDADLRSGLGYAADLVDEWPELEKRIAAVRQLLRDRA